MITLSRCFRAFGSNLSRWTPLSVSDVPRIDRQYEDFTKALGDKYPGFDDTEYFSWLHQIRQATLDTGNEPKEVVYPADCQETWKVIYSRLRQLHYKYACEEHKYNLRELEELGIYSDRCIPQFPWINQYLADKTGFKLVPVGGMINSRSFLNALAFRIFFSTQYLRHKSVPFYSPEPDVVHELMGHVPLFADPDFAEFSQEIGICSLGASDEEIAALAKLYFYGVEFRVIESESRTTVLGAGILGSCVEIEYVGQGNGKLKKWNTEEVLKTEFELSALQPLYYSTPSMQELKRHLLSFLQKLPKYVDFDRLTSRASLL
mmetsp:Transcript_15654/g.28502  ORF Transcript_15654/g.28502 Transcript_15654/m.28502 type:complete len:319 (+) Transcript_15654:517-1473(+)